MVNILGIRHHGVGSAKNVLAMLKKLEPDIILVEGPPELEPVLSWVNNKLLKPPVSILGYNIDTPKQASFYPFSEFSPEWQAISYANAKQIPVRMLDLPLAISYQLDLDKEQALQKAEEEKKQSQIENNENPDNDILEQLARLPRKEPIAYFSEIAGYTDSELWWEHNFEQKYLTENAEQHFEAIMLMMENLRQAGIPSSMETENVFREAYMREIIRKAQNEFYSRIVVVCGAWHAPVLRDLENTAKADTKILKGLPKTKIKIGATWIPWTNARLSMFSGYGAGITSPGWYRHLWKYPEDIGIHWLTKVARLFRKQQMDISTAHVIETFRLAEALAALRNLPRAGLSELTEATLSVMCMGDAILLELVRKELIVADIIGKVPDELPKHPLQNDFEENTRKLRLQQSLDYKEYEFDLRKETDLNRSIFLYRLLALDIPYGQQTFARSKGTFKEAWRLKWEPEMMIALIEKSIWGNTIEIAASTYLLNKAQQSASIADLAALIQQAIPAELFVCIESLLFKLNEIASIAADIAELMKTVVPLVSISRYGNVRNTDLSAINTLIEGFITRIAIGLANACYGLDDTSSERMFEQIKQVNDAVRLLNNETLAATWEKALFELSEKQGVHPIIIGCTCRLLFDAKRIDEQQTARYFGLALSKGQETIYSAGWLEGFLKGSSMILLLDNILWNLLYKWVAELQGDAFLELLPILRRTFSKFEVTERKQLGEKAKKGTSLLASVAEESNEPAGFNAERANAVLLTVAQLLGIAAPEQKEV